MWSASGAHLDDRDGLIALLLTTVSAVSVFDFEKRGVVVVGRHSVSENGRKRSEKASTRLSPDAVDGAPPAHGGDAPIPLTKK